MIPHEVFLSHAATDKDFADRLATMLRRHGVPVWYSPTEILGAQQWQDEIGAALKRCDWFLIVLSKHAVRSFWVHRELSYALQKARYVNRITPILLTPCQYERLSWVLGSMQFVNFSSEFDNGCRDLLRVWGIGYKTL